MVPTVEQPQQQQRLIRFFTVIFYVHVLGILAIVIYIIHRGLALSKLFTPLLASVSLISGVLSLLWPYAFIWNIRATVKVTVFCTPILTILVGIFLAVHGHQVLAVLLVGIFIAIFGFLLLGYSRSRIGNTHDIFFQLISIYTGKLPPRTKASSVASVIVTLLYVLFLLVGIGVAIATRTGLDFVWISIIMISMAWTMQVFRNVQTVAISKATYVYFRRGESMNAFDAISDTLKNHLGSVIIGSAILPFLEVIKGFVKCFYLVETEEDDDVIEEMAANKMVSVGNIYGFAHVGVYSKNFFQASKDTWTVFRRTAGLEQLIKFDLTGSICFYSAHAVGAICALAGGIWGVVTYQERFFELTLYSYVIGFYMGRVGFAWLQACVVGYYAACSEITEFDQTLRDALELQERLQRQRDLVHGR